MSHTLVIGCLFVVYILMDLFWPYMVVLEGFRDGFALLILSVSVWGHWAKSHDCTTAF